MLKRSYSFAVGFLLIIVTIIFFIMPVYIDIDAFFPFMFALVSFILGIIFFFMGYNDK